MNFVHNTPKKFANYPRRQCEILVQKLLYKNQQYDLIVYFEQFIQSNSSFFSSILQHFIDLPNIIKYFGINFDEKCEFLI
ncbi:hypothetical protein BpHYR1_049358 [Brachionus plicatilis]|uniref:Uncharacterized protein n=1 Tax=Brachionus plicatilis TaxID=10195 RepID=A0A3M7QMX9_BRAPC|nr:hypothetical protein BpHYR1_049358 [Brachionus plicatilis]